MSDCGKSYLTKQKVVAWTLVGVWAVLIFVASATSGFELDTGAGPLSVVKRWLADVLSQALGQPVDPSPIGHFAEYFVFGALLLNALRMHWYPYRAVPRAIAIAAAYAAADEFHQLFVPGRACDPTDWLVDVVAVAVGVGIAYLLVTRERRRVEHRPWW